MRRGSTQTITIGKAFFHIVYLWMNARITLPKDNKAKSRSIHVDPIRLSLGLLQQVMTSSRRIPRKPPQMSNSRSAELTLDGSDRAL